MTSPSRFFRFLHAHLLPLAIAAALLILAATVSLIADDMSFFATAALGVGFILALSWISFV